MMDKRTLTPVSRFLGAALGCFLMLPVAGGAQLSDPDPHSDSVLTRDGRTIRALQAVRIQGAPPGIDGDLSDPVWRTAPMATDFVQMRPREGEPATERTEARILYDDHALYVAIRAWDSEPDSIAAQLTRRDQGSYSDLVHVVVDSYHDRRTAFHFAVNPLGVKLDMYRYDDSREDIGWDAVWDVATRIDSEGWTAEFRIPLSQLRFSAAPVQTWGINFGRDIARRSELATWAPLSENDQALVSRSGELRGIRDLSPPRRLEVLPYAVARMARTPGDTENPFHRRHDPAGELGADVKLGLTNSFTLDLAVNPDFGQVEADPAQVNLSAFETFLPERRPFFQEGAGIFRFGIGLGDGDGGNQTLFYSRRIGRAPQGRPGSGAEWADAPSQTRILAAGKLSGKSDGGWSLGVLGAVTGSEEARVFRDGEFGRDPVEPRTGYSVLRVQRDFRQGESALGVIGTGTYRDADMADALGIRQSGYAGGLDFRHRFRGGTMELRGNLLGSHVEGSPEAMLATQRSSARYFQRPDQDHMTLDPEATSMQGWSSTLELWKMGGGPWRFGTLNQVRSPGFEVNDLGFMPEADYMNQIAFVGYFQNQPGRVFRNWRINTNAWSSWTFGGEHQNLGGNLNGGATFHNNWNFNMGGNVNLGGLNTTLLRGGPAFRVEPNYNGWGFLGTDGRRSVQVGMNLTGNVRPDSDSWTVGTSPSVRWRPSERTTLRVGTSFSRRVDDRQWVGRVTVDDEPLYLFGRIDQTTVSLNLRADMALTPTLTVQLYAQPFVSTGGFEEFKRVTDPRGERYDDRFAPVDATLQDGVYQAELNGTPFQFGNPAFNFGQFRSNAVLRWEYRPGSTIFLVWAQGRDHFERDGEFRAGRNFGDLFGQESENVLMLKVSYWLNP
jgi:hypothetical protein